MKKAYCPRGILFVGMLVFASAVIAKGADKVDVCHVTGNGSYHLINISTNAVPAHLAHGDGFPGQAVPGDDGTEFFNIDCTVITVTSSTQAYYPDATFDSGAAGLRIKGAAGPDVYLGVSDLGVGGNRVEADAGNPLADGTYPFTFSFNRTDNAISLAGPAGVNLNYDFDTLTPPNCAPTGWNAMVITIRDSDSSGGVGLQNVMLDSVALGNYAPPDGTPDVAGTPGWQHWIIQGFDFSQSFTLGADLVANNLNDNESLKVQILVGCYPD